MNKIRVIWICIISNDEIRKNLSFNKFSLLYLYNKLQGRNIYKDCAQWNSNAINEFKKFKDIDLHIISPHSFIKKSIYEFKIDNINYHIFKSEDDNFISKLKKRFTKQPTCKFLKNSKLINSIITKINPDIIHLIGPENPEYSTAVIYNNFNKPLLVSLQTLLMDPNFRSNYHFDNETYNYRANIEKTIINKANYIGTPLKKNLKIIKQHTYTKSIFLNITLALSESINIEKSDPPIYDFVYFSKELEKAADWALESFIIAHKLNPNLTLHMIGGCSKDFKRKLDSRIKEAGIDGNISFSGSLPTHNDVISQVKKARFALLPLKIDYISGTIREAISCGLPVITTKTLGTPILNEKRDSVLIANHGDFNDIANKMIQLYNDNELANKLQQNAIITINEKYNNKTAMEKWVMTYNAIIKHYNNNEPILKDLILEE